MRLGEADHIALVLGERERTLEAVALGGIVHLERVVGCFGVVAGDHDDRDGVIRGGQQAVAVEAGRRLTDEILHRADGHRPENGAQRMTEDFLAEELGAHAVARGGVPVVEGHHVRVQVKAFLGQGFLDAVGFLPGARVVGDGRADQAAEDGFLRVEAPKGDLLAALVDGETAVFIFQKDSAFGGNLGGDIFKFADNFLDGAKLRIKVGAVVVRLVLDRLVV